MLLRIPLFQKGPSSCAQPAEAASLRMKFYRHSQRERFQNPLPGGSRVAVLSPHFLEKGGVRCFDPKNVEAIVRFNPEILAGTVAALLHLAGDLSPTKGLIIFSGFRIGPVSKKDRDILWRAFQIPAFEQCFGPTGAIIARECEAHDGLHLTGQHTGPQAIRNVPCACGRREPRM